MKNNKKYIITIDQGTTSSRILLINKKIEIVYSDSILININKKTGGVVTQNANEILSSVKTLITRLFTITKIDPKDVDSISITNQRETTIIWNKKTNEVIDEAINWQASNTKYITDKWIEKGYSNLVKEKTGLLINPYFSASKIKHLLNNYKGNINDLMFGTVDSYLLYNLTVEKNHYTDITNASRTMIYNINTLSYDKELLGLFDIPLNILPKVLDNDSLFGHLKIKDTLIPINGVIGDQQSALFGHLCTKVGDTKITYGTGCFILTNTKQKLVKNNKGIISTIGYKLENENQNYALEGSVFMGGSAIDFMKEKLNLVNHAYETDELAKNSDNDSVYVVPAFVGLGAPYWDDSVRGSILGLEASTKKEDILKATLNSIAYQVTDILKVIENEEQINIKNIKVDGKASNNDYLMQFQSNVLNKELVQNYSPEITAFGAAYISGLKTNFFKSIEDISNMQKLRKLYNPNSNQKHYLKLYNKWLKAVNITRMFKEG